MLNAHRHVPAMLLAAVVGWATSACAGQVYRSRGFYGQAFERRAYDNGRREGLAQGRDDARNRREYSFARHDEYRDADKGYRSRDGNRDVYRQAFRQGYQAGYTESFNQIARTFPRTTPSRGPLWPGNRGIYVSPAASIGYRDGMEAGLDDGRRRRPFDPARSSRYRSADHDYDRRYGSKEQFRQEYRVGFHRGYEDGFSRY